MKSVFINKGKAPVVVFFMFLLSFSAVAQDGWGEDEKETPAKKVLIENGTEEVKLKGQLVKKVFVKNVSQDTVLIYNFKINEVTAGDVPLEMSKAKINVDDEGALLLFPEQKHTIATVSTKPQNKEVKVYYTYSYFPLSYEKTTPGKPAFGKDYVIYAEIDTVNKTAVYFLQNFSSKKLLLKEVSEDIFNLSFRSAVYYGPDKVYGQAYKTVYEGPENPEVVAPGKRVVIWKDQLLLDPYFYEEMSFKVEISFK